MWKCTTRTKKTLKRLSRRLFQTEGTEQRLWMITERSEIRTALVVEPVGLAGRGEQYEKTVPRWIGTGAVGGQDGTVPGLAAQSIPPRNGTALRMAVNTVEKGHIRPENHLQQASDPAVTGATSKSFGAKLQGRLLPAIHRYGSTSEVDRHTTHAVAAEGEVGLRSPVTAHHRHRRKGGGAPGEIGTKMKGMGDGVTTFGSLHRGGGLTMKTGGSREAGGDPISIRDIPSREIGTRSFPVVVGIRGTDLLVGTISKTAAVDPAVAIPPRWEHHHRGVVAIAAPCSKSSAVVSLVAAVAAEVIVIGSMVRHNTWIVVALTGAVRSIAGVVVVWIAVVVASTTVVVRIGKVTTVPIGKWTTGNPHPAGEVVVGLRLHRRGDRLPGQGRAIVALQTIGTGDAEIAVVPAIGLVRLRR